MHSAVMCSLYTAQGFQQGLSVTLLTLLLEARGVTSGESAAVAAALLPFSFKFCWAPVVDSQFISARHRRVEWIVVCQIILIVAFSCLAVMGEPLIEVKDNFNVLVGMLYGIAFVSATQDIAVDAWAVEGVADRFAGYASFSQSIGLTVGVTLTKLVVSLIGRRWMTFSQLLLVIVGVYVCVLIVVGIYATCAVGKHVLASCEHDFRSSGEKPPTIRQLLHQMWLVINTERCRAAACVLCFSGLHAGVDATVGLYAVSRKSVAAVRLADLGLAVVPLSLTVNFAVSHRLSSRETGLILWRWALWASPLASVALLASYSCLPQQSFAPALVSISVCKDLIGTVEFAAACFCAASIARLNPRCSATTMTLLLSMSNAGRSLPVTAFQAVMGVLEHREAATDSAFAVLSTLVLIGVLSIRPFVVRMSARAM